MIGNDIACLNKYDRTPDRLNRAMSKVCTNQEISAILSSFSPFKTFVLIWTLKESVFKAEQRIDPTLQFKPALISSEIDNSHHLCVELPEQIIDLSKGGYSVQGIKHDSISGTVKTPSFSWATSSLITKNLIHTISFAPGIETGTIYWGIKRTDSLDRRIYSKEVREFASSCIGQNIGLQKRKKPINWAKTILPAFHIKGSNTVLPISFSHDMPFLSFAYIDNSHR